MMQGIYYEIINNMMTTILLVVILTMFICWFMFRGFYYMKGQVEGRLYGIERDLDFVKERVGWSKLKRSDVKVDSEEDVLGDG